ncbi:MAG TPA: sigma-70 family RNA polymerase sigma factor [Chitinophagaceae bacterium]|nr:sigma-70 family RNA polymerase sigma factor [Chitinophagaceae bacterium]
MMAIKQFDTLTDAEIIRRIIAGEKALFEILIRRNNPYLYKVGMSYGYNHQDVEDLMQETFISAFIHLDKFENRSSFKTWVVRIMLNQCYQKTQRMSFKNEKSMETSHNEKVVPMFQDRSVGDTYKTVANKEISQMIGNALLQIPVEYRMIFCLRELSGMSTSETADAVGITETNVKVRLNRAKHMLRQQIEKMYSPSDIFEFNLIYCDSIVNKVMDQINKL